MRKDLFAGVGWAAVLLLAACGGSSGGDGTGGTPPVTAALWSGQHHLGVIEGPGSPIRLGDVTAAWGVAACDGVENYDESAAINFDGSVFSERPGLPDITYTVDPDRTVHLRRPPGEFARGRLSAAGDLALLAASTAGGPTIRLYGRREGTYDETPLSGTWRLAAFAHSYTGPLRQAIFGSLTLNTGGTGSLSATINSDGLVGVAPPIAAAYGVFADGRMQLALGASSLFEGGLLRGGDVIVLAGDVDAAGDPTFMVLVREVAAPTVAALAGSWQLAGFGYDLGSGDYFGLAGPASVDAAGVLAATLTKNTEGVYATLPPVGGSWAVDGAGVVTLTLSGGATFVGRAAPGNDLVIVAGATTAASSPAIFLLLR